MINEHILITLIMNKTFIGSPKLMRKMAMALSWSVLVLIALYRILVSKSTH